MNTSRDVCLKFGKQAILKHIIDSGSWIGRKGYREMYRRGVPEYLAGQEDGSFYHILIGGSRQLADNNDIEV